MPDARDAATDAPPNPAPSGPKESGTDFVRALIDEDLEHGTHDGRVVTRFPPEPNGYLHIGHAKSICLNFGLAGEYAARGAQTRCRLRFDDTNPTTESEEYARSIEEAVRWLGFTPDAVVHASDYFEQLYDYAVVLIEKGLAYVDSQSDEEIRARRGTVTEPGTNSPFRDRSVEENIELFRKMRAGAFEDGAHVLRAKIDMAAPLMIMRDPLLYRIRHAHHYRTGDAWCIYPMYDFAHCLEDAIEHVTHSLCTLEFDNNRRVYDWVLENALPPEALPQRPHQYEFNRLNLTYTVLSKRKLLQLVEEGHVGGWNDPRMPTLFGLRRRGVTPEAVRALCDGVGVTRTPGRVQVSRFEHAIRDDLNERAPRVMAVLRPLKVTVTNFAEEKTEWLEADYWPRDIDREETRHVPFSRTLYLERDDFMETPSEGFYRLAPGREVRLRYGYFFTCEEVVKDADGQVTELRGTVDLETKGGDAPDGRSPEATLHWLSADHAVPFEARLYDRLFDVPAPDAGEEDYRTHLNPDSLVTLRAFVEPSVQDDPSETRYQFERQGYFWQDPKDSAPDALVFNQIVPLRDAWAEREEAGKKRAAEARRQEKEEEKVRQRRLAQQAAGRDLAADFLPEQKARFARYTGELDLSEEDAALLAEDAALAAFFERAAEDAAPPSVANWIVNELMRALKDRPLAALPFTAAHLGRLVALIDKGALSTRAAKDVFEEMLTEGGDPEAIVERKGLRQMNDADKLEAVVAEVVAAHPDEAERYRSGKHSLIGFFMGQVMRQTRGTANPETARALLKTWLSGS